MSLGAWQAGPSRARPHYLILSLFIICLILILSSCAQANNCDDCELTRANITNIAITNSTDALGNLIGPKIALEKVNATFCGCPNLTNFVVVSSTDQSGRNLSPKIAMEEVNLIYWAGLDVTKIPSLVTDLDEVGLNLALVEYNITIKNIGEVNVTGIEINDPLLGNYSIDKLTVGQELTIFPHPIYLITQNDTKNCTIHNMAEATGKDRCCKPIGPYYAYADFPLSAKNLEDYLKIYSVELHELGYDIKKAPTPKKLEDFEQKIRIQANRLMTFEDMLHGNITCPRPDPLLAPQQGMPQEQTCCPHCARRS
jgi:uncharacterized repeat protein (TIGR01451 family)